MLKTFPNACIEGLGWIAAGVNVVIFISCVDDAFIDAYYWIRELYRALTVRRKYPPLRTAALKEKPEQPLAIMIPAWREFSVISDMVEAAISALDYECYDIFIGTYSNDPETCGQVERLARRFNRVHRVQVPHAGPTSKADCLNWIIQAILQLEKSRGERFGGIVLHDSEDVIHPLELKLFNFLVTRKDLIQLPVLSLECGWFDWVAGTYQDDFAEWHGKDLVVRESLTGLVPCAGVGACYSRRAIEALCEDTDNHPFNTETLTEDYDFSFRLKKLGMTQIFVKVPVVYPTTVRRFLGGTKVVHRKILVGVREYFPNEFRASYRQRARWILGIGLQGWQILGWPKGLSTKYLLFRDRKGLLTSLVTVLGYALFLGLGAIYIASLLGAPVRIPDVLHPGTWVATLMYINACFMVNRVLQRFIFVTRLFGPIQGLLAIPRILVGNVLNFVSAVRAWRLFIGHLMTGKKLAWDKTVHSFPTQVELLPYRRKLGEILLAWEHLSPAHLDEALADAARRKRPLGEVLVDRQWIDEALLADALAEQHHLPRSLVTEPGLAEHSRRLPIQLCLRYGLVPLGPGESDEELIGVASPPPPEAVRALSAVLAAPPKFFIITESELASSLHFLTTGGFPAGGGQGHRLMGAFLVREGLLSQGDLDAALLDYHSGVDGRLGDFLVSRGLISRDRLESALRPSTRNSPTCPGQVEVPTA